MRKAALLCALMAGFALASPPQGTFPPKATVGSKALEKNGKGLCEWGSFQIDLDHAALHLEKRSKHAKRVEQLNGMMSDIKDGQSMVFTHKPGAGLHVVIRGRNKGTIKGGDLARMFFTLYLGDIPPDEDLKKGLLALR
jgi:hypothetical protein